jgi:diguanylate cyclase (GGDEF)-like protein
MALCLTDPHGFARLVAGARSDELTGCLNATALSEMLEEELNRCRRLGHGLACAFIDLDNFKLVNDRDGHMAGDAVLAAVGCAIRSDVRSFDGVARFGGDEFVVVMPGATEVQAQALIGRLVEMVAKATLPLTSVPVRASAGITAWEAGETAASLLDRADRRLLEAKDLRRRGGRRTKRFSPAGRVR